MKKFSSFLLMLLVGAIVTKAENWSYPTSAIEDPKGTINTNIRDGSKERPYTIGSAQELANFAYYVNNHTTGAAYKDKYVALTAENICFERKGIAGWTTLCLPFNISQDMLPENAIIEEVIKIDTEKGKIYTQTTSAINAGEPFLLYCEDEDFVISLYEYNDQLATSPAIASNAFYGTFAATDIEPEYFVIDESGEFFVKAESNNVLPFNAYLLDEKLAKFAVDFFGKGVYNKPN